MLLLLFSRSLLTSPAKGSKEHNDQQHRGGGEGDMERVVGGSLHSGSGTGAGSGFVRIHDLAEETWAYCRTCRGIQQRRRFPSTIRPMARITAVRIPGTAQGSTMPKITRSLPAPKAMAPSLEPGTARRLSSVVTDDGGRIQRVMVRQPAKMEVPMRTLRRTPCSRTGRNRIEGMPDKISVVNRWPAPASLLSVLSQTNGG